MKVTTAISTSSLLLCFMAVAPGKVSAQSAITGEPVNPPATTTTTTTTTPVADPWAPVTPGAPVTPAPTVKKTTTPSTTNVEVNTPPASPDTTTTTKVQVDTPPDAPAGTTNVEITTPPAVPLPKDTDNVVVTPVEPAPVVAAPMVVPYAVEPTYVEKPVERRIGAALTVGGGVVDFTGSSARDMTNTGGYWNARIISGTRQFLGVEAAYNGSARDISALGLSSRAMLVSNGVEGAFRLNVPIIRGRSIVEPFAFAGLGWSRYNIARSDENTSSLASSDDIMEIPYGGGLSVGYGGFLADARFTYRSTYYNDMMQTPTGSAGSLNNWAVGGQLGVEF